jgi:hypothetical protein
MNQLLNKLKQQNARTGLNQSNNQLKMAAWVVGPFIAVWLGTQLLLPVQYSGIATIVSMAFWIMWIGLLYAQKKSASRSYIPFPQSHWFFQDGQQQSYDILLPPNGFELTKEYHDGTCVYKVGPFKDSISYQDSNIPYPTIFKEARWKLPGKWNDVFSFNGHCEFFFESLFVDHPTGEYIQVNVVDWQEEGDTRIPTCLITGCSVDIKTVLTTEGKEFPPKPTTTPTETQIISIDALSHKIGQLQIRNSWLEKENERLTKDVPHTVKELSDKGMSRTREEVNDIMDTAESKWRYFNLKSIAIALIVISLIALAAHFLIGWP